MAKREKTRDPENTARRRLADAQAKFHSAQERRSRTVSAGDLKLDTVRQRVGRRIDKATKEVERRAAKVARAEARLLTLQHRQAEAYQAEKAGKRPKVKRSKAAATRADEPIFAALSPTEAAEIAAQLAELEAEGLNDDNILIRLTIDDTGAMPTSVDAAADHIAAAAEEVIDQHSSDALIIPDGPADQATDSSTLSLGPYELRLLVTLREQFGQTGATFTDWLGSAGMSKRTFLRARTVLVDAGLAERHGTGQGARYFAVESTHAGVDPTS